MVIHISLSCFWIKHLNLALVLYKSTAYKSPLKPINYNTIELNDLSLVDPKPFNDLPIDSTLGAVRFGACLLPKIEESI